MPDVTTVPEPEEAAGITPVPPEGYQPSFQPPKAAESVSDWRVAKVRHSTPDGEMIEYRCVNEKTGDFFSIHDDPDYVTRSTGVKV